MRPDVLEHVADGVVVADPEGRVRWMNPAAERLTGRSLPRAAGKHLSEVFPGAFDLADLARRAAESNSPVSRDGLTLSTLTAGGLDIPFDAVAAPLEDGVVFTLRDRTVARTLEADARKTDRLASFATIAAGIAHEVKNPLGGIKGAAQLLGRRATEPESREFLDVIVREVDRIAALVDRLRDLASADRETPREQVDLNRLLHELALLQGTTGEALIELDFDTSLPPVAGDADGLRRLFLNLVRNALEAPAKKVRLVTRVETGRRFRDPRGRLHPLVRVMITDDGPGIPAEHEDRLFEPFFTTKVKGTGLGLAAAQRVVHDHGGTIELDSPENGGTRVIVILPAETE